MKSVQMLEYQKIPHNEFQEFSDFAGLQRYLERAKLTSALTVTAANIKATSWVGVVKYKNLQIEILPKLITHIQNEDGQLSDDEKSQILGNLVFMLSYTKELNIKSSESAKLANTKNPFLEVLIREYATSLFDCLKRLTPKNYVREEDNLNYLRGKLKFNENIKYNCANKARFYCEYDEYSENNILNQLFLYVAQCLYSISCDSKNKQRLKQIIDYFCDIKFIRFNSTMCEKIKLTRQQQLFEKPFKLAKMFVENSSVDISKNQFENITLLWDMNKLFEEFIYQVIRRKISDPQIVSVEAKPRKYTLEDASKYTEPDIVVKKSDGTKIIIDTKYKKMESISDLDRNDSYQVGMYCLLHDKPGVKFDEDNIEFSDKKLEFDLSDFGGKNLEFDKNKSQIKSDNDVVLNLRLDGTKLVIERIDTDTKQKMKLKRANKRPKTILLYPKHPEVNEETLEKLNNKTYPYNAFTKYELGIRTVNFIDLKKSIKEDLNGSDSKIIDDLKKILDVKS